MNKEGNKYKLLINDIDGLISELNIVRNHVLNHDFQTASEYTDGIVTGSEELRDKVTECNNEYFKINISMKNYHEEEIPIEEDFNPWDEKERAV